MAEDDIYDELYGDLEEGDVEIRVKEQEVQLNELDEKLKTYEQENVQVGKQIKEVSTLKVKTEGNLFKLLVTARAEVSRKNNQIESLRRELDNLAFRRKPKMVNKYTQTYGGRNPHQFQNIEQTSDNPKGFDKNNSNLHATNKDQHIETPFGRERGNNRSILEMNKNNDKKTDRYNKTNNSKQGRKPSPQRSRSPKRNGESKDENKSKRNDSNNIPLPNNNLQEQPIVGNNDNERDRGNEDQKNSFKKDRPAYRSDRRSDRRNDRSVDRPNGSSRYHKSRERPNNHENEDKRKAGNHDIDEKRKTRGFDSKNRSSRKRERSRSPRNKDDKRPKLSDNIETTEQIKTVSENPRNNLLDLRNLLNKRHQDMEEQKKKTDHEKIPEIRKEKATVPKVSHKTKTKDSNPIEPSKSKEKLLNRKEKQQAMLNLEEGEIADDEINYDEGSVETVLNKPVVIESKLDHRLASDCEDTIDLDSMPFHNIEFEYEDTCDLPETKEADKDNKISDKHVDSDDENDSDNNDDNMMSIVIKNIAPSNEEPNNIGDSNKLDLKFQESNEVVNSNDTIVSTVQSRNPEPVICALINEDAIPFAELPNLQEAIGKNVEKIPKIPEVNMKTNLESVPMELTPIKLTEPNVPQAAHSELVNGDSKSQESKVDSPESSLNFESPSTIASTTSVSPSTSSSSNSDSSITLNPSREVISSQGDFCTPLSQQQSEKCNEVIVPTKNTIKDLTTKFQTPEHLKDNEPLGLYNSIHSSPVAASVKEKMLNDYIQSIPDPNLSVISSVNNSNCQENESYSQIQDISNTSNASAKQVTVIKTELRDYRIEIDENNMKTCFITRKRPMKKKKQ